MSELELREILKSLADESVFALLIGLTSEGEVVLRPIGGKWGSGIIPAIKEMNQKYPGCKMKLLERNYDDWFKYFSHVVSKEQVL